MSRKYTDAQMLDELRRVAELLGGVVSRPKYEPLGRISSAALTQRFGGWLAAVNAAGLTPAYRFGGTWFACPICGTSFRSDNGTHARRTCSEVCSREMVSRQRLKGDRATPQAARGRVRKWRLIELLVCARCGHDGSKHRIEAHHRDGDPYNNDPANLEALCSSCHRRHHDRVNGGRHRAAPKGRRSKRAVA